MALLLLRRRGLDCHAYERPEQRSLYYLFADHLPPTGVLRYAPRGSINVTSDTAGYYVSLSLYTAWGGSCLSSGSSLTDYRFTGQRKDSYIKLDWYGSRWYDPYHSCR